MADLKTAEQQPAIQAVTAEGRYTQLESQRSPALMRGRDAAALTIPALLPPEGATDASTLPTPFQSVGARGVNNLSSKLLLALFPPGSSFFRLTVDTFMMDKLKEKASTAGEVDPTAEVETALSKVEQAVLTRIEQKAARPTLSETFKHLLVTGNGLLRVLKEGALKFHPLSHFVCKRDTEGEPVEIVVREGLSRRTLPPAVRGIVESKSTNADQVKETTEIIWLYTWISRQDDGSWKIHQEVLGTLVPGTDGTYPKGKSAWLPLRWTAVPGSDYGRGLVEEYLGDMRSLEALSQSIVEFAANAAKVVWLVDEGGVTSKKTIAEAPSGSVIDGVLKDIGILTMEKFADFQVVSATADKIEKRLEQAFLLNSSIQRQAERVTAEEIRFMAGELEQALGGTYSTLAHELQRPLVVRIMLVMAKTGKLPSLPEELVSPQIITGLDGLGRSSDLMKLDLLIQGTAATFGPEAVSEYVNVGAYMKRRAASLAVDIKGVIRSEQEVQQSRAAAAQSAMTQKLGPAGIKAMSDQAVAAQSATPQAEEV